MKELVSAQWLNNNLENKNLIILDARPIKDTQIPINQQGIPNARLVNIKEIFRNKNSRFPNTFPPASQFEKECQALGINSDSEIVVYDNLGIHLSPRVWWLFKTMGHKNVSVLNGGLPNWIANGFETVNKEQTTQDYQTGNFVTNFNKENVLTHQDIMDNIASNKFLLIDVRSKGRFNGTEDEPRKHLKSGCIPNSVNIPYKSLLENGRFKPLETLNRIFSEKATIHDELVFSCGSGITACIGMLACEIAFKKSRYLYDGSWTEFAELNDLKTS